MSRRDRERRVLKAFRQVNYPWYFAASIGPVMLVSKAQSVVEPLTEMLLCASLCSLLILRNSLPLLARLEGFRKQLANSRPETDGK